MGEHIEIVNPAYETAMDLKRLLEEHQMENDGTVMPYHSYEFYVSDAAEKFCRFANTVMPFDISQANIINIEEY
jgi:glutamate racemase